MKVEQPKETPRQLGYRMPAEWEPHEATWLAWPHARPDWPGKLAPIPWVYGEVVRHLAAGERVRDPRLDFFRGSAMFIIFIAHCRGNFLWDYIPARFGLSERALSRR